MKSSILVALIALLVYFSINSCKKENFMPEKAFDTVQIVNSSEFLKNIPIHNDTVLFYGNYDIDFRIEIENHNICDVKIISSGDTIESVDKQIISTGLLHLYGEIQKIGFLITAAKTNTIDTVVFRSDAIFKKDDNLGKRYVNFSNESGRLKLTWNELDKANTKGYSIERIVGKNQFTQHLEVSDSILIDEYYVGEGVTYNISVVNKDNRIQKIWHVYKEKESRRLMICQKDNNYRIKVEKCPYYNNFGRFLIYQIINYKNVLISSSEDINDTAHTILNAKFADEARFYYEYYPKTFPTGANEYTSEKYDIYNYSYYGKFGNESFEFDGISRINENNLVFTKAGKIFWYDVSQNIIKGSISKYNSNYGFLRATPMGEYFYVIDQNISNSPIYLFSFASFSSSPSYTFNINYIVPPVSDNLIAIMGEKSSTSDSKLAIYNTKNGNNLYTTGYQATSESPRVSSNGLYFFINSSKLILCKFNNNNFEVFWEEKDLVHLYSFYDFDPLNPDIYYLFDSDKNFTIKSITNNTITKSYVLNTYKIVNIDYYSQKILAYDNDKLQIFNLNSGELLSEIPANLSELFAWSNKTTLINNVIYNNQGLKYILSGN